MLNRDTNHFHIHVDGLAESQLAGLRRYIYHLVNQLKDTVMATAAEHTAKLEEMATRAEKVKLEILAALAVISSGNTTAEQDAAVARIEAVLGGLDDLTVDPVV